MKQKDDKVTLEGVAQSDARVSSLMKKIDESEWLTLPKIYIIKSKENKKDKKRSVSTFKLEVTQETLQEEKKP
jgi:type IV pilus assembly protein PilN